MTDIWVILPRQDDGGTSSYRVHEDKDNRLRQIGQRIARGFTPA